MNWVNNRNILGNLWKKQRKILTPAFHFQILTEYVSCFKPACDKLIEKLSQQVDKDRIDIMPFITLCSLDVLCGLYCFSQQIWVLETLAN